MNKYEDYIDILIHEKNKKSQIESDEWGRQLQLEIPVYEETVKKEEKVSKEPRRVIIIDI